MILAADGVFRLDTPHTTYLFHISETGHAEHLYYGPRLTETGDLSAFSGTSRLRMPTIVNYAEAFPRIYPALMQTEASAPGKGDLRETLFSGELGEVGNTVFDFRYRSHSIRAEAKREAKHLPQAGKERSETLALELADDVTGVCLELTYTVYEDSDVIVRSSAVRNGSSQTLTVRSLYSLQLDLEDAGWEAVTLDGAWIRERQIHRTSLKAGMFGVQSLAGASSAEHNPLMVLEHGEECCLFNLLWSGDHREIAEVSPYGSVRVLCGINPGSFSWRLQPGETFHAPEAIMLYTHRGEAALTKAVHDFVRRYIVPAPWRDRERPILLNSWEGTGIDVNEEAVVRQAEYAASLGIELYVIDDGWFRKGTQAKGSMGDWEPVPEKFPNGLRPVCDRLHEMGLLAGIWAEPEMISMDSALYRAHPEYLVRCPGREPCQGRDEYLLDMTRDEVVGLLFGKLEHLIGENGFDYLKWDMNRYLADDSSPSCWTPEFRFRWTMGLYSLLQKLTHRFPGLLIEGCASGGGRFDLGILCYVSQFWGSDNTDATSRVSIFEGTALGYPQNTFGAHVSRIPNGITGRAYDYETAFHVNAFGAFGYELDVTKLTPWELHLIRSQIVFYKYYRKLFQFGTFRRVTDPGENFVIWTVTDSGGEQMLALYLEKRMPLSRAVMRRLIVPDCSGDAMYRVTARPQWVTAADLCARRGGPHMSEEFSCTVPGALLKTKGMALMPVYQGTDYPEEAAYLGDYGSRMFVIERCR